MRSTVLAIALLSGCAMGAPPGFSPGTQWTFPLVEPQSGGRLVTPIYVEGKGPYLFAFDPDAPITIVDPQLVGEGGFMAKQGGRRTDEHDVSHPTRYTRLTNVKLGDLSLSLLSVAISDPHQFDADGRRIYGVLGHDVIADSLVFGFDRDRGIAWLTTQEAFHPPPGAHKLEYQKAFVHEMTIPRRLVHATVNGVPHDLHADLGDAPSQLDPKLWGKTMLRPVDWNLTMIDEAGTARSVMQLGIAQSVVAGGVSRESIAFAAYDDRRFFEDQVEGTLGLDFFQPYVVDANWNDETLYLVPRQPPAASRAIRFARWGQGVCADAACVHVELVAPKDEADQRPILRVTRDEAAADLEVVLQADRPAGPSGMPLPTLEVDFPAGANLAEAPLDPRYHGSTMEILDVSPFPRRCPGGTSCVLTEQAVVP